jgi:hypothetical protein
MPTPIRLPKLRWLLPRTWPATALGPSRLTATTAHVLPVVH